MPPVEYRISQTTDFISTPRTGERDPVALAQNILIQEDPYTADQLKEALDQGARYFITDAVLEDYPEDLRKNAVFIPPHWAIDDMAQNHGVIDYERLVERAEAKKYLHIPGVNSEQVYDFVAKQYPEELQKIRNARMAGASSHDAYGTWANVGMGHILSVFAINHGLMLAARAPKDKLAQTNSFALLHDEDKRLSKELGNIMKARALNSTNEIDRKNAGAFRDLVITAYESYSEPPYNAASVDMRNAASWGAIESALRIGDSFTGQHNRGGWNADGPVDPALRLQQLAERANSNKGGADGEYWWQQDHSHQVGHAFYGGRDMYQYIIPEVTQIALNKMTEIILRRNPGLVDKYGSVAPENLVTIAIQEFKEELERESSPVQKQGIMQRLKNTASSIRQRLAA